MGRFLALVLSIVLLSLSTAAFGGAEGGDPPPHDPVNDCHVNYCH